MSFTPPLLLYRHLLRAASSQPNPQQKAYALDRIRRSFRCHNRRIAIRVLIFLSLPIRRFFDILDVRRIFFKGKGKCLATRRSTTSFLHA
jgi:hypothetical protein